MRARPVVALLGVLLATQAACTDDSTVTGAACVGGDDARKAAASVLERRTAAVRDGDLEAFLATSWRDADPRGVDEQRARFDRIQQLPEHTLELTLGVTRASATDSLTAYVNQKVQLAGIDEKPVAVGHRVTFERHGGCWLVDADEPDDLQVVLAPWDAPDAVIEHRDDVLLVTDETDDDERRRILDTAADAWRDERRILASQDPRPDDVGVVVLAFTTDRAMKANGFYYQSLELTGGVEIPVRAGSDQVDFRVLVNPSMLESGRSAYLPQLMRHEFVHVLLARHPFAPVWATEGVAEYYASGRAGGPRVPDVDLVPPGSSTGGTGLPTDDFYAGDWAARSGNYAVAWAAMAYLADAHGRGEPARLVRALHRARAAYDPKRVDRVLEQRYGLSTEVLGARARQLIARLG
ncbi:hypothetical protein ASC77_13560 [Nocardioides sp. Root1257]|uniref:hypothetical protein n=1 Tax=unclassified Nocardioides TaxID=2615069 RepID=UPI0006F97250|nr:MULTISPECIES: hypothetical protein [unclassified Nocardioides]KQW47478.1 hypothetical protein ASC77_13560 [Nocardioides sp. Root1257]KRC45634.1 hypothetical protein ASE24_13565 [Nocardioides sp. Root224]